MSAPNYRLIAREAIPVKADCYNCDKTWTGSTSRNDAAAHHEATGHATWVECKPKETE